jgi:cyclase
MLRTRIVLCLDVRAGKVVKGVNFVNLREMGEPAAHARFYNNEGADELVILDITASGEGRGTLMQVVESVADELFIPLTVGGGVRTPGDVRALLQAGADRASLNTAAVENPGIISESAARFGTQCIVVAIDARKRAAEEGWDVYTYGGKKNAGIDAVEWAREAERRGAGEILLTSMDRDGTQIGFDIPLMRAVTSAVGIPVIASGGAGTPDHFVEAVREGGAAAVLAASLFHTHALRIGDLKTHMKDKGVAVR